MYDVTWEGNAAGSRRPPRRGRRRDRGRPTRPPPGRRAGAVVPAPARCPRSPAARRARGGPAPVPRPPVPGGGGAQAGPGGGGSGSCRAPQVVGGRRKRGGVARQAELATCGCPAGGRRRSSRPPAGLRPPGEERGPRVCPRCPAGGASLWGALPGRRCRRGPPSRCLGFVGTAPPFPRGQRLPFFPPPPSSPQILIQRLQEKMASWLGPWFVSGFTFWNA